MVVPSFKPSQQSISHNSSAFTENENSDKMFANLIDSQVNKDMQKFRTTLGFKNQISNNSNSLNDNS